MTFVEYYHRVELNCGQLWLKDAGVHFLLMVEHFGAWSQVWPRLCPGTHGKKEASRCVSEPECELMSVCMRPPPQRMSVCGCKIVAELEQNRDEAQRQGKGLWCRVG